MSTLQRLDGWTDRVSRGLARRSSRRAFVSRLGTWLVGGALAPLLLPVARVHAESEPAELAESGDPRDCDYWRYCAQSGPLCSCCGGAANACPPGDRDVAHGLDRHLSKSGRRQAVPDLVQRLLRQEHLSPVRVQSPRERDAGLSAGQGERCALVLGQ